MQVLIVDSDIRAAELLRTQLGEIMDGDIMAVDRASVAVFDVEEGIVHPDVCFIDLRAAEEPVGEFGKLPGLTLAQRLTGFMPGLQVIFTSASDDFYLKAYEAEHVFFLRKPIDADLLRKGWLRALDHLEHWKNRYFSFRFARETYRIPARQILFIEKDRRRVILHAASAGGDGEETYCFYGTMDDALSQLDHHFMRCHNSYIVNLARVDSWARDRFSIRQHKIPISRQYAKAAKAAFLDAWDGQMLHG